MNENIEEKLRVLRQELADRGIHHNARLEADWKTDSDSIEVKITFQSDYKTSITREFSRNVNASDMAEMISDKLTTVSNVKSEPDTPSYTLIFISILLIILFALSIYLIQLT